MTNGSTKLGTLTGVTLPGLVLCLAALMFTGVPALVGDFGLWNTLVVLGVAHALAAIVAVAGASAVSHEPKTRPGVGGPLTRGLGAAVGSTVGIAVFSAVAGAVSLFALMAASSLLPLLDVPADDRGALRLISLGLLGVASLLALAGRVLAFRLAWLVLPAIGVTLFAIHFGQHALTPEVVALEPLPVGRSLGSIATLGLPLLVVALVGIGLVGRLSTPHRAVSLGALGALGLSLLIHVGAAFFLTFSVDRAALSADPGGLAVIAIAPWMLYLGLWSACLGAALLGLHAAAGVLPGALTAPTTPGATARESLRRIMIPFGIATAGILIGDVETVASLAAALLLAAGGALCLAVAVATRSRPDFRPRLRVPVSLLGLGAVTSVALLALVDPLAPVAAAALLVGVFLFVRRDHAEADEAAPEPDAGPFRGPSGEWRPRAVIFSARGGARREATLALVEDLLGQGGGGKGGGGNGGGGKGGGDATDFELVTGDAPPGEGPERTFLRRVTAAPDPFATIEAASRFHGFGASVPDTAFLDWDLRGDDATRFVATLEAVREAGLNTAIVAVPEAGTARGRRRIDLWLRRDGDGLSAAFGLMRVALDSPTFRRAEVRIYVPRVEAGSTSRLERMVARLLEDQRIPAHINSVRVGAEAGDLEAHIREESAEAGLVIIATGTSELTAEPDAWAARVDELAAGLAHPVVLVRSSEAFDEAFRQNVAYAYIRKDPGRRADAEEDDALPPLRAPDVPALRAEAQRFADGVEGLAATLHDRHLVPLMEPYHALIDDLRDVAERQLAQLDRGLGPGPAQRQRKVVARVQSGVIFQTQRILEAFEKRELPAQETLLAAAVAAWRRAVEALGVSTPGFVVVERPSIDFEPDEGDSPAIRRVKRRRRLAAALRRGRPTYRLAPTRLHPYYLEHLLLTEVSGNLEAFAAESHHLVRELGRLMASLAEHVERLERRVGEPDLDLEATVDAEQQRVLDALDAFERQVDEDLADVERSMVLAARRIAQGFATDLDRLDYHRFVRRERRLPSSARALAATLAQVPKRWRWHQQLVLHRSALPLRLAGCLRRLKATTERTRLNLRGYVQRSLVTPYEGLLGAMRSFAEGLDRGDVRVLSVDYDFSPRFEPELALEGLMRDSQAATLELPETLETLTDQAMIALEAHPFEPASEIELPLRRAVGYLIEAELVAHIQEHLAQVPDIERHAQRVAQDVLRLMSFTTADLTPRDSLAPLDESALAQLRPIVNAGLARVEAELDKLRAVAGGLEQRFSTGLDKIREQGDPHALLGAPERVREYARKTTRRSVWAVLGHGLKRAAERTRSAVVGLVYHRTHGVLLARRLRPKVRASDTVVDRGRAFVAACTPREEVVAKLPFYYRQLFLGRSANDSAFWVAQREAAAVAERALARHREGVAGALVVVGDVATGRSSLTQTITRERFAPERVFRVRPRPGGSIDPEVFRRQGEEDLGLRGEWGDMLRALPPDAVVVVENVELWWERSPGGLAVIDVILDLVDRHGDQCLFVLEIATPTFRAINRFRDLSGRALGVVECAPVDARALREIIELRHRSSGMSFTLAGRPAASLGDLRQARLYAGIFDASHGRVGAALAAWVRAISRIDDGTLRLEWPEEPDTSVLDDLSVSQLALLVQLLLHRQLTDERLERLLGRPDEAVAGDLATLVRMGLIHRQAEGPFAIDRFVAHHIARHLESQELLP